MRGFAKQEEHFLTEQMFSSVYDSEFCNEQEDTISYDWDYEQFFNMYNRVQYLTEYKYAQSLDHDRESKLEEAKNRPQGR